MNPRSKCSDSPWYTSRGHFQPQHLRSLRLRLPLGAGGTHDFHAPEPGLLCITDVTEFALDAFKRYLSPDVFPDPGCGVSPQPGSGKTSGVPNDEKCIFLFAHTKVNEPVRNYLANLDPEEHCHKTTRPVDSG